MRLDGNERKLIIGCGYLGRRVARAWLAQGFSVSALTRSPARAAELSNEGIEPIVGDICDPSTLAGIPPADTVLFAVGYDRNSGKSRTEVSVDGLRNVLKRIVLQTSRVIYVSTTSVYGQSNGEWVDEQSECHPSQPGGEISLQAEQIVEDFVRRTSANSRISANILRLSGIYGPGRLLARTESLRAGEIIPGRGDAWLNLIHVEDAVLAVLACEDRGDPDRTYLVTDDRPIRREEYFGLLAERIGAPAPQFNAAEPSLRGSGALNKRCSNRRLREELCVALRFPTISEGLTQALIAGDGPEEIPKATAAG